MWKFLTELPILVRYLIAGGTSTAIDLGILYILTEFFGWWYLASATAAFVVAAVVSFIFQKFYTFGHHDSSRAILAKQSVLYLALQIANVGINTFLMYALVEWVGVWYFTAQIIAAALIAVESFFIYRFFIFVRRS
ncbi:MAG: GtrA family protein [bacterium]|nr:GtrA family protein [bacterium]